MIKLHRTKNRTVRSALKGRHTALWLALFCGLAGCIFTSFVNAQNAQSVVWTDVVYSATNGSQIEKTGGCDGCGDAHAVSTTAIASHGGYTEVAVGQSNKECQFGLASGTATGTGDLTIGLWFRAANNVVEIREGNTYRAESTYSTSDTFRITSDTGVLRVAKNGQEIHSSQIAFSYPLKANVILATMGAKFTSASLYTGVTAPAQPSALSASAASTTQINLAWSDASQNETGFKIERKLGASGTYQEITTVGANVTSYNNTGLTENRPYVYRVRAYNAGGNSGYSAEAFATTLYAGTGSIKEDSSTYPEPSPSLPPLPPAGGKWYDETFGTQLLRVTDAATNPETDLYGVAYAYTPTFNSDNSYILCLRSYNASNPAAFYRFDSATFTAYDMTTPPATARGPVGWEDAVWSSTTPNKIYAHLSTSPYIYTYNPATQGYAELVVGGLGSVLNAREYVHQMSLSNDEDVIGFTIKRDDSSIGGCGNNCYVQVGYAAYRVSTGQIIYRVNNSAFDEVQIDKSGRYLVIKTGQQGAGQVEVKIADLQTSPVAVENVLSDGQDNAPGHSDNGFNLVVGASDTINGITARSLSSPHSPANILVFPSGWDARNTMHVSLRADNESWALVSVDDSSLSGAAVQEPFHREIFQVATDGSGAVRRLAHHGSAYNDNNSATDDYNNSPRANISRDGKFVAFTSNWGVAGGRRDLFILKITPALTGNVVWTSAVNATPTRSRIQKTGGCDGCDDARAVSVSSLASGDGFVEVVVGQNDKECQFGLNNGTSTGAADLDIALWFRPNNGNYLEIRENGTYKAETTYSLTDKFRIVIESGVIKVKKNGNAVYTSDLTPAYPLKAHANFWSAGAKFNSATMSVQ